MRLFSRLLSILLVVSIPLFLVTTAVVWAVNDLRFYNYEFQLQKVAQDTGMSEEELLNVARRIRGYFNSRQEPLSVRAVVEGHERDLFNQREIQHMADVKRLIWGVYGVQWASFAYILGWSVVGLAMPGCRVLRRGGTLVLWGCALTVAFVAAVGLAAWVDFDSLFVLFHRLSFADTLWQLDPARDYLIRVFPERFWSDVTFFIGLTTVAMALVLGTATGVWLRVSRGRRA